MSVDVTALEDDRLIQFLDPDNFERAWDKVATNRGCAGVDRETIAQFGAQKQRKLALLIQQVARGVYRPLPLRQFTIPKKRGGEGIPQGSVVSPILANIYLDDFDEAFQRRRLGRL